MSLYKETDEYPEIIKIFEMRSISQTISNRFEELVEQFNDSNQGFFAHHFLRAIKYGASDWLIYESEEKKEYDISIEIFDLLEGILIWVREKNNILPGTRMEWQIFSLYPTEADE